MTAAGTIAAAKVFVLGAGVAGLQAIATARRLGAIVRAYDVRQAVKEQVESVGATFVGLNLEAGTAEDNGGYVQAAGGPISLPPRGVRPDGLRAARRGLDAAPLSRAHRTGPLTPELRRDSLPPTRTPHL